MSDKTNTDKVDAKKAETLHSREYGIGQFEIFSEKMDLAYDVAHWENNEKKDYRDQKEIFIRSVQQKKLAVMDDGTLEVEVRMDDGKILTVKIREPRGTTLAAADGKRDTENTAKTNAMLGQMTNQKAMFFNNLLQRDYRVFQAVIVLFMLGQPRV